MGRISIGDEAPNFDLSSTESVLLMLRDEVTRAALVLYFFSDGRAPRVRRDLEALNRHRQRLSRLRGRVLAISPAKMAALTQLQGELDLRFPLLRDDRGFSAAYGVEARNEGQAPPPALVVVDRKQIVRWLANPVTSVEDALPQVERILKALPSQTASYPRSIVNRLVDRWVN